MAHLALHLLGSFQATLGREPITNFESTKVRALLAYLAVEGHRIHRRQTLVGLLWPDYPEFNARRNLSRALTNLRTAIGDRKASPPFLLITHESIQFNTQSDYWLDVHAFNSALTKSHSGDFTTSQLKAAIQHYTGSFLEGLSVKDSPAFDDWTLIMREQLQRKALTVLQQLVSYYANLGVYNQACDYAWRQVELEPWNEEAQYQLMRLLGLNGQRSAALVQYDVLSRILDKDLDIAPAHETTELYLQIRDGKLPQKTILVQADATTHHLPSFFNQQPASVDERTAFVARKREITDLNTHLEQVLKGNGHIVFVTGEAGQGKTALMQAFAQRAQASFPQLLVVHGRCNAYTGIGDPFLPFRDLLAMLTGDIEDKYTAGAISRECALRLWRALPLTAQALMTYGPDLIETFIPGIPLMERAASSVTTDKAWLDYLRVHIEKKTSSMHRPGQQGLFEQLSIVLQAIARQVPLLLIIDDMQWADIGSINLLFHLGRRLTRSRILIIGAYRAEEVALGRDGDQHPLALLVNEFQRTWGDIEIDLSRTDAREFIEAFVDHQPNHLDSVFRDTLLRQTDGHPLFTIELWRGMQERGELVKDEENAWVQDVTLIWEKVPVRVEAVIAEHIHRLPKTLQHMLRIASVEGETFTAEVVARVLNADTHEIVSLFSEALSTRYQLTRPVGVSQTSTQRLLRYRFRHVLFQTYLYQTLDRVERPYLHEQVANALEMLYRENTSAIAPELARHFEIAQNTNKAVQYLLVAGKRAIRLSANQEAINHLTKGLDLIKALPASPHHARQELDLHLALTVPLQAIQGYGSPEVLRICTRARELCQQLNDRTNMLVVLAMMNAYYAMRGVYHTAIELGEELLGEAQRVEESAYIAMAHLFLGWVFVPAGDFPRARLHLEQTLALYDPQAHQSLTYLYAVDLRVSALAWLACTLWFCGYPDQALEKSQRALTYAQKLRHSYTLAFVQSVGVNLCYLYRGDFKELAQGAQTLIDISEHEGFTFYQAEGQHQRGWAHVHLGQLKQGMQEMEHALEQLHSITSSPNSTDFPAGTSRRWAYLAEAHAKDGDVNTGLHVLSDALALVEHSGECIYEAELHRLRGELMLMSGDAGSAEMSFLHAINLAQNHKAKSWELRATTSLARLWQHQGKCNQAQKRLAAIYNWFTEGFTTRDLLDAKSLLDDISLKL